MIRSSVRRRVRRLLSVVLVALAVSAGLFALAGPTSAASAPTVAPTCPAGVADRAAALAKARACGTRVEVLDRRTGREQIFANPNGTYTLEASAVTRRVRRGDGTWAAVDTSLRADRGAVRPVATGVTLDFSPSGAGPMARVATDKGELALTAPWPLPAPTLVGSRATYVNVLPGVDLVLVAKPEGFSETLVVRTRESLPALASIRFGVAAKGLTLKPDGEGFVAVDPSGVTVFASPAPKMWDSTGGPGPADAARVPDAPVEGDRVADIALALGPGQLTLTPDRGLLADPKAVLPFYIDPQISAPRPRWAYSNSGNYNYDDPGGVARVGQNPECCGGVWRGFFEFSIGAVAGSRIHAASFNSLITHSWNCTNRPVTLYRTGGIAGGVGNGGRTPWSPGLTEWLASREGNSCNAPSVSYAITNFVQSWADQGWTGVTLGLVNGNEGNSQFWRKFAVGSTNLIIDYNFPPPVPDELATVGTSQRASCATASRVNATGGIGLAATVRDVDAGATVLARYEWQNVTTGSAVTALPDTPFVAPPHAFQATLPASSLPNGHTIQWRVRGFDGRDLSAFTPWCQFTVDNSTPGQPSIDTADLPPFPASPPATTRVASTVVVTFQPAAGDFDIVGYYYGVGAVETVPTIWVPSWPGGSASVPIVPVTSGLAKNFLTVVAVDEAGNRSPLPASAPDAPGTRQFRANATTAPPTRVLGDATGDGKADMTLLTDVGGGQGTLWRWNANPDGTGFTNPTAVQDVETRYPIASTRTVQGDFDGDRLSDVAIFTQDGANVRVSVQRSNGNALFGAPAQTLTGWNINNVKPIAGNFDADAAGRDDIAVVYNDGNATFSVRVLVANGAPGSPTFAAPATWYTNPVGWADWVNMKVFAGDFDGDGRVEMGHIYQYPSCVTRMWIHFSTGAALTTGAQVWDSGPAGSFCWAATDLVAGDFDADGRGDVVALHDLGNCTATLIPFYGNADRTMTNAGRVWTSAAGAWCGGRTMLTTANASESAPTDVAAVYRCCSASYQVLAYTFASNGRTFGPARLKYRGGVGPRGTLASGNYLIGAKGTASSSAPTDWGWSLPAVTDGVSGGAGWSSWSNVETPHTEWIELTLPEPGDISRVVMFPRGDAGFAGQNFPRNFTIEVFDGTAWATVVTRTDYPSPTTGAGHAFTFTRRNATKVRITGTGLLLMQFAELEAYHS
jgi:hypothetical protein